MRFVGRSAALADLAAPLAAVAAGRGGSVLIEGEAGIGKTRLVDEALATAPLGPTRRWATCRASEKGVGLRPWRAILGSPVVACADPAAMVDDIAARLVELAGDAGLVAVLDDLHWADAATLAILPAVLAELRTSPVLLLATARPGPAVGGLRIERRLRLGPLDERAVEALVASAGWPIGAGELFRRSGGNPLFATELGELAAAGATNELPPSVAALVAERTAGVGRNGAALLAAAAVLGDEVAPSTAAAVAGLAGDEAPEALGSLVASGLLRPARGEQLRYRFTHALLREGALAALSTVALAELHGRAAEAVEAEGAPAAIVAHHRVQAAVDAEGARAAVAALRTAAEEAADDLAFSQAAATFDQAVALAGPAGLDSGDRGRLLVAAGAAFDRAGRPEVARERHLAAAALARRVADPDLLASAALGLGGGPGGPEVPLADARQVAVLREALAAGPAPRPAAHLLARLAVATTAEDGHDVRLGLADAAVAAARASADDAALADALAARCDVLAAPEHAGERSTMAADALAAARRAGHGDLELLALRHAFVAHLEQGETAAARATVEAFDRRCAAMGQARHRWYVHLWRGCLALLDGDVERCAAEGRTAAELGARAGSANAAALTLSQRVVAQVAVGNHDDLAAFLESFVGEHPHLVGPRTSLAYLDAVAGRPTALPALEYLVAEALPGLPRDAEWLPLVALMADVAAASGSVAAAAALLPLLEPVADRFPVDGIGGACTGVAWRQVGVLRELLGDSTGAERALRIAVERNAAAGAALGRLRALGDLARVQARSAPAASETADEWPADLAPPPASASVGPSGEELRNRLVATMRREGALWAIHAGDELVRVRHGKGMAALAVLLERPGAEVHVLDLDDRPVDSRADRAGLGPALDERAKAAYRDRLVAINASLDAADSRGDAARSSALAAERALLLSELSSAVGLGGRDRPQGTEVEKARVNVTKALRLAITRLAEEAPTVGAHFDAAVRTGTWCSYRPDPSSPLAWVVAP